MLIGVLSDSHGRLDTTSAAVSLLLERGAEVLLHLGDLGGAEVIDELPGPRARIVFGNCDGDLEELRRHAEAAGVTVDHPLGRLVADGRVIAFTHGHLDRLVSEPIRQGADYLLLGHTHAVRDERVGPTRVINPGALHRAARYTCALLDPARDALRVFEIAKGPA